MRPPVYDAATLAARAEIADVLHLITHAMDRHRWTLMTDAFHADATVKYSFRPNTQRWDDWAKAAAVTLGALAVTLHRIGNILIDLDDDGAAAWVESYVTAIHRVPVGAPAGFWDGRDAPYDGTGGARYVDRFERRQGRWKIAAREALIEWRHDAPARDGGLFAMPPEARGGRGDADVHSRRVVTGRLARLQGATA